MSRSLLVHSSSRSQLSPKPSSSAADPVGRRAARLAGASFSAAHVDDLGAGKALQHRLHQRIGAHAASSSACLRVGAATSASARPSREITDHPAPAGPVRRACAQIVASDLGGASAQRDFEPAVLEAHQPHLALQRELHLDVALLGGERDQVRRSADGHAGRGLAAAAGAPAGADCATALRSAAPRLRAGRRAARR